MPFFGSLSDIFASLSPRRRPDDRPSAQRRPPSRTPLAPPLRRPVSDRNPVSLGSDSQADHLSPALSTQTLGTSASAFSEAHRYADYPSPTGPSIARGQLRSPTSQFVLEPTSRQDKSAQMKSKGQPQDDAQARQDEARLFGANYKEVDAVRITPGATVRATTRKTHPPGALFAPKPTDTISRSSRESGPVRARGRPNQYSSYLAKNPRLSDVPDFEESGRPNKRRRRGDLGAAIDLENDDPVVTRRRSESQLSSPESTRQSAKSKTKGHAAKISEFRDVENHIKPVSPRRRTRRSSSTSLDQRFTESAAQQRRGQAPNVDLPPPKVNVKSGRHSRENVLDSVEITKVNETAREAVRSQQSTGANETRRVSDRESPDELQGEATTQPLPKSLREKHQKINRKIKGEVQQLSPSRKRSPADIEPTDFMGSPRQSPKRAKRNQKKADERLMSVSSLRLGFCKKVALPGKNVSFRLGKDSIEVEDISGPGKTTTILARHIQHAIQGRDPSCKVRIQLSQTAEWRGDKLDIEFLSVGDKNQLMHMLQEAQIKIQSKEMAYMDKVFTLNERQWEKHDNQPEKPLSKDNAAEPVATPRAEAPATSASARKKVSAALQDDSNTSEPKSLPRKKDTQENSAPAGPDDTSRQVSDDRVPRDPPESKPEPAVEIPVKTSLSKPVPSARETRSAARRSTRLSELPADSDILNDDPQPSPFDHDTGRERWRKPLVYPWTGKKKAEVNLEDRDRLREGEFLNDNLIAFYIRFLQDHLERTNPEAAKRVYFFNSYFFETLKNTPKGTRGINYAGVEKWTRSIDLFSYDYIVVPINENAHWYVAIICNLPNLDLGPATPAERAQAPPSDKEASNPLESEIQEIPETPEPEPVPVSVPQGPAEATAQKISEISLSQPPGSPRDGKTHPSVDSMVLVGDGQTDQAAQEAPLQEDEWPEADECPTSSPMKFLNFPASKRSATTPQPARNSAKPRIITLDSLDQARAPTVRMLRDYITKEAATKREVEIDSSGIKGMRARQIPLQPNYSDCGLYLLAYVEKFVQHPDPFITKILDKQMNVETDWPPLGSGLLRHRLRSFLDDLYEEQAGDKTDNRWIMADQQPVSFLLGPPLPAQDESADDAQAAASPQPEESTADVALGETAKDDRVEVQIKGTPPPK